MITVYGNDVSSPCNKVRYVANYLGIGYEYKPLNLLAGEGRTPEHLKRHPAGKVPVIVDGDFVLFESNAIIKYLAQKESSELYPKDPRQRLIVDQWMDFVSIHIAHAMGRVFYNSVGYQALGGERDERSLKDGHRFLERFLPVVDAQLAKHQYLAGPDITVADFCLLATLDQAEVSSFSLDPYPSLKKWREKLLAQDFYQKCFKSYAEMLEGVRRKMEAKQKVS